MTRHRLGSALVLAAIAAAHNVVAPPPAGAQTTDDRWTAWLGCWEPQDPGDQTGLVCFRPADGGVEMFTFADGELRTSQVIRADGQAHPVSREGCSGSERAEFSVDGRRVFQNGELTCAGDNPRVASGLMSLSSPTQWLDVRSVAVDGESVAWVQRYMLATPDAMAEAGVADPGAGLEMAVRAARMAASRTIDADDVIEATRKVDAKAVEAWVAERGEPFDLDARALLRLAAAGVPGSVTDVMVAVSYPRSFQLDPQGRPEDRPDEVDRVGYRRGPYPYYGYGVRYSPFFYDPFYFGYGYGYGYPYSRYGYGYGYGGYYGYRPATIVVRPQSRGRFLPGSGYVPRSSGGSVGTAQPRSGGSSPSAPPRTAKRRSGGSGFVSAPSPAPAAAQQPRTARRRNPGG